MPRPVASATRVLVVDGDPLSAAAHAAYTDRVEGFTVVGVVHTAQEAIAAIRAAPASLLVLDLDLPDMHGLELCRALRTGGVATDVVVVTAVRDLEIVRAAVSLGVTNYLLKPFTFASFREKLLGYARYRSLLFGASRIDAQHEVDRALAALHSVAAVSLPKGVDQVTLDRVLEALQVNPEAVSAAEMATRMGMSRVTARRYLEHLAGLGRLARHPRYGGPGRPELEYRIPAHRS